MYNIALILCNKSELNIDLLLMFVITTFKACFENIYGKDNEPRIFFRIQVFNAPKYHMVHIPGSSNSHLWDEKTGVTQYVRLENFLTFF